MKKCRICETENELTSTNNLCVKCWVRKVAWKWNDKEIRAGLNKEK